jgi:hypothetical protein
LELRNFYDPDWNPGDGVRDNFPNGCVSEEGNALVVHLPYGNCLRGTVRFAVSE